MKVKIYIKNLLITDIPSRTNRIFLKLKSGKNSIITKKYQIEANNSVSFDESIIIEQKIKDTNKNVQLKFSFRIEKSDGKDFIRYGALNVENIQYNESDLNAYHISSILKNCKEKAKIDCDIIIMDHFSRKKQNIINNNSNDATINDHSLSLPNKECFVPSLYEHSSQSAPCFINHSNILIIDKNRNSCMKPISLSYSQSKMVQIKVAEEKYKEIEGQIDDLLASIINNN